MKSLFVNDLLFFLFISDFKVFYSKYIYKISKYFAIFANDFGRAGGELDHNSTMTS